MRSLWAAVGAGVLVLALSACSGQDCTSVSADPGVSFDLSNAPGAHPMPAQVTSCVQQNCTTDAVASYEGAWTFVRDDALGAEPVVVTLLVQDVAGARVVDARVEVSAQQFAPNGQGCSPVVWRGWVSVDPQGALQEQSAP
jgi:hypothetical protein